MMLALMAEREQPRTLLRAKVQRKNESQKKKAEIFQFPPSGYYNK
jgi:hypothetical protein